ncbi:MAG: XdhC family protein [Chloroflexota bacterium]|nr:XdhC family protein [Chloroflexota bacterium]MDE3192400.1 XdhC family protein [Chloroflexota bacterium]
MREIYQRMAELEREGRRYAVCTVVRTVGSTPQVVGAKMIVDDLGRLTGTLGGGCVEGDAFEEARTVLRTGETSLREYELTEDLAWDTGLVCGGTMWIWIEPGERALTVDGRDVLGDLLVASTGGHPVALATLLRKNGRDIAPASRLVVETDGRTAGALGDATLDAKAREVALEALRQGTARVVPLDAGNELLVEPVVAKPRLVIAGGGHVGLAIARMATLLEYEVTVIDDRPDFATRERFPDGVEVMQADMVEALETMPIGWNTFVVIATRGHKLDSHCLRAAVKTQARYVGLLGSRRKTILVERMLRDEGVPEERLRDVHAPIGLDLGGRTPPEIALAIMAELSKERFGGSGRPLRLSGELYERAVAKAAAPGGSEAVRRED